MAVVYQHRRKDTNEVFYIGIGKSLSRAYKKVSRNPHWHNVVNKSGFKVDILIQGCSLSEACDIEIGLIKDYGRHDLGLGPLVNQTDGGEGNFNPSITQRLLNGHKISIANKGKIPWNKGIPLSQSHINKLRLAKLDKPRSEDIKKVLSDKQKGLYKPIIECPYCNKIGGKPAMKRWHFNNCKKRIFI
jgi:hypothetical protein